MKYNAGLLAGEYFPLHNQPPRSRCIIVINYHCMSEAAREIASSIILDKVHRCMHLEHRGMQPVRLLSVLCQVSSAQARDHRRTTTG